MCECETLKDSEEKKEEALIFHLFSPKTFKVHRLILFKRTSMMKSLSSTFVLIIAIFLGALQALPASRKILKPHNSVGGAGGSGLTISLIPPLDGPDVSCPTVQYGNNGTTGYIYSPNYPSKYPSNSDCTYNIQVISRFFVA